MKILNLILTTRLGGIEQVFLDYNEALTQQEQMVISVTHKNSPIASLIRTPIYKLANFSKYDLLAWIRLKHIVVKEQPNIIIAHGNRACHIAKKAASHVPVVGICHNYSFDYIKNCDYIISVTNDMAKILIDRGYISANIFHIPNMINTEVKREGSIAKPPVILTIGTIARLDKIKGVEVLITALHILKQEGITLKAKIAGDGKERQNIQALIRRYNLESEIEMLGWITDKSSFYNSIDVLCMPSLVEPFGLVILEAFAYGKPIIMSNLPGPTEIARADIEALTFAAGDAASLASTLKKLLKNTDLAKLLVKNSQQRLENYSIKQVSKQLTYTLIKCYEEKLKK